jgi:glycosyltransferase involved in cell wall biosynthesis
MIYFVTPYGRAGASSRVRVYEWLDRIPEPWAVSGYVSHRNASASHLLRHPVTVLQAERRLRQFTAARPTTLVLHREASPLSRGSLERQLLRNARFSVYDFDDALHCDWGAGGLARHWAPKAPKAHLAVAQASRVVAGSPVLADWASQYCRDVVLIPSCVAPEAYRRKTHYQLHDPPRLGWIGSADNEIYLQAIAPALEEIHSRTGARLTLLGTRRGRLGDLERFIDRVPWSEAAQHELLADLDVGLFPVPDDPYTRGKCGYKLLQYAAAGVPALGTPVGVNRELLACLGMPAPENDFDWVEATLDLLRLSTDDRARLGGRARDIVELQYSYSAWLPTWRRAVGLDAEA